MDGPTLTRRVALAVVALATVALAAGCAPGRPVSASPASPFSMPPVAATSARPTPDEPQVGKLLVSFGRQGGFAGMNDQLLVNTDGTYELIRNHPVVNRKGKLSPADLKKLRAVLANSGFAKLPAVQAAKGSDLFTYQVIYGHHQVIAMDGGMVPAMKTVVAELSHLLTSYSGR